MKRTGRILSINLGAPSEDSIYFTFSNSVSLIKIKSIIIPIVILVSFPEEEKCHSKSRGLRYSCQESGTEAEKLSGRKHAHILTQKAK